MPIEITNASSAPSPNWNHKRGSMASVGQSWRVRFSDWLPNTLAMALHRELDSQLPWQWVFQQNGAPQAISQVQIQSMARAQIGRLWSEIHRGAVNGFQFSFRKYSIVEALRADDLRYEALKAFIELLANREAIERVRHLSGISDIQRVDAQATRYDPGDFLTEHTDDNDAKFTRRIAYVLNLSPNWRAEWGGLLLFHDVQGQIVETFVPEFNTLNLFSVPQAHSVSMVTPFAKEKRLALTGWFTA
jgi:SM-20-related protein